MKKAVITIKKGISVEGNIIIPYEFDDVKPAIVDTIQSDTIFILLNNNKYGIAKIDFEKERYKSRDCEYECITAFINKVAIISQRDEQGVEKYGLIDTNLNIMEDLKYDLIQRLSDEFLLTKKEDKYGVINCQYKQYMPCIYSEIKYFDNPSRFEVKL